MFPNIQSLDIFSSAHIGGGFVRDLDLQDDINRLCNGRDYVEQILHFDVMANSTHALPFFPLDESNNHENLRLRDFEPNLLRNAANQILMGSLSFLEPILEATWTTTIAGVRMPMSFRRSQEAREVGFVWKDMKPPVRSREDVEEILRDTRERFWNLGYWGFARGGPTPFDGALDADAETFAGFVNPHYN
jgi:hypothetical protein